VGKLKAKTIYTCFPNDSFALGRVGCDIKEVAKLLVSWLAGWLASWPADLLLDWARKGWTELEKAQKWHVSRTSLGQVAYARVDMYFVF
jgi:hypothetical protein